MNGRISVSEVLEVIGNTLRTVDVRTVALRENSQWTSVLSIVRFSHEDNETVAQRHLERERVHGTAKTQDFQIVCGCFPFADWSKFVEKCNTGALRIGQSHFQLPQQVNLNGQQGQFIRYNHELREEDEGRWPGFQIFVGNYQADKLMKDGLGRQLAALGWGSIDEAISSLCGIEFTTGSAKVCNFYLFLPLFAQISNVKILTPTKTLAVSVAKHKELPPLTVIATIKEQVNAVNQKVVRRTQMQMNAAGDTTKEINPYEGTLDLESVEPEQLVEIKLVHPALGDVGSVQDPVRSLIPIAERNVLWEAFKHFCPEDEIEEMLAQPHDHTSRKIKPSAAFELHVSWLLGMYGFSTIVLGEYEKIFARKTGIERGSVDILAAKQASNLLALVACTLAPPSEPDFANLAHVLNILRREVFANTQVTIQPILFTGATTLHGSYKEIDGGLGQIPIVDVDKLRIMLDLVRDGEERVFHEFVTNPMFHRLEKR